MKNVLIIATVFLCATGLPYDASADSSRSASLVVDWNDLLLTIAQEEDGFLTLKGVRAAAMMHLSMHDAIASIEGKYSPYAYLETTVTADATAATNQAAYFVALDQYPEQKGRLLALRDKWNSMSEESEATDAGIALGTEAARTVLLERVDDGWDSEAEYSWHPMGPGVYAEFSDHSGTPQGFIFGASWAKARGFALKSADQFRAPAVPEINSDAYTKAFNEVKNYGRFQSMFRTPDQTHLALWWKDFAENSHNRLARDLAVKESLPLADSARLFALLNMSIFDAYISAFENKFFYNHWRPYTAIRWAANDGNEDTHPEELWTNTHRHTYPFPSYPSAHGTACAAAMSALAEVFGEPYPFTMTTETVDIAGPFSGLINMQPATRRFDGFFDAAMECSESRIYLGIHFRYDSVEGFNLGRAVGSNVVNTRLTPVKR